MIQYMDCHLDQLKRDIIHQVFKRIVSSEFIQCSKSKQSNNQLELFSDDNIIPPPPAILNGAYPTRVKCSNCGKIIRTVTVIEDSTPVVAWLMGALFCIMG